MRSCRYAASEVSYYLHGLLPEDPASSNLDNLVVSSGDFGLAYLTERWAARFVSELLRNFVVCFVGYSIDDPVLRYMMDALAADRLLGESPPEMFAFGSHSKGQEEAPATRTAMSWFWPGWRAEPERPPGVFPRRIPARFGWPPGMAAVTGQGGIDTAGRRWRAGSRSSRASTP